MIVVACNLFESRPGGLRETFDLPMSVIGRVTVGPSASRARNGSVSSRLRPRSTVTPIREIARLDSTIRVTGQACPLFVPLVEEGWYTKPATMAIAKEYLKTIIKSKSDALILGCTHYPLLKNVLRKVLGPKVKLVDSAEQVALDVRALLEKNSAGRQGPRKARYQFFVSDEPAHFQKLARRFLGFDISEVQRCHV